MISLPGTVGCNHGGHMTAPPINVTSRAGSMMTVAAPMLELLQYTAVLCAHHLELRTAGMMRWQL